MSTKAEYGLQTEAGLYIDIEQAQNTTSTNPSERTIVIGLEQEFPGEIEVQATLVNDGLTTGGPAGYADYTYDITAVSTYDGTTFTGGDIQWTMTTASGVSESGTGASGTVSLPSETVNMTITVGVDEALQTKVVAVMAPGAIGTSGVNVSMSQIATFGGKYFSSQPGDWFSKYYREGITSRTSSAMCYNYNGWRLGYAYDADTNIQWFNDASKHTRDTWGMTHYMAENAHSGATGTDGYSGPFINGGECHPQVNSGINMGCVYSWTPPKTGTVRVVGTVYDAHVEGSAGNGVQFWVGKLESLTAKATEIQSLIVPIQDTVDETYVTFDKTVEVSSLTEPIVLYVGPKGEDSADTTLVRLNIWYIDVDMTGDNLSLRDMTERENNFKVAMPRFVNDSGTPIQSPTLGTGNNNIKMSYHKDTFLTPDIVKLDESKDTAGTAEVGNAFLKVQLLAPPTVTATAEFRLYNHKSPVTNAPVWEKDWTAADGSLSVLWTDLLGSVEGAYGVETKITKPTETIDGVVNPSYTYTLDSNRLAPGIVNVERGLYSYV